LAALCGGCEWSAVGARAQQDHETGLELETPDQARDLRNHQMSLVVISSERFADHLTPVGHPDCPERADVMTLIANEWRENYSGDVVSPREASREHLA